MSKPRRTCVFNADLQKKYAFMKKGKTESSVICEICNSTINIATARKTDIEKHLASAKHKKALNARSNSRTVTNFFASSKDYTISACEGVWSYHVIRASHSFKSSDCASKFAHASKCAYSIARAQNARPLQRTCSPHSHSMK